MNSKIKKLKEEKIKLVADARKLVELAETEKRELTTDEEASYGKFLDEAIKKQAEIDREEKLLDMEKDIIQNNPTSDVTEPKEKTDETEKRLFVKYIREGSQGLKNLTPEEMEISKRALSVGTTTAGGYLVPVQFQRELEKAMKQYGGMLQVARIISVGEGGTLDWPTVNDTGNTGYWLGENTVVNEAADVAFGRVQFSDYIAAIDLQRVSLKLLQDSAFDVEGLLRELLAERMGRFLNDAYTTGDGSSKPTGILAASGGATLGKTAASSSAIASDELFDLKHSLDPAYRLNATWMFNDSTLKSIAKLKDTTNQYIWQPVIREGEPERLLGHPLVINQDMASIGVNAKTIMFGNFQKYIIRNIGGLILLTLRERYADYLQVGFIGFQRTDGKLIDAGTHPVKYLRHPNT